MPYRNPDDRLACWRRHYHLHRAAYQQRHKERYDMRKAAGVCTSCGKQDARPNRVMCAQCAMKEKA